MRSRIPSHLAGELRAGRVIPFVGAGVSRSVLDSEARPLFPSWTELLLRGVERIQDDDSSGANLIRALLSDREPNYLQAADRLRKAMRGPVWVDFLKEQLDPRSSRAATDSLALARAVWELGSSLIITTNYDRVLDWACPDPYDLRRLDNNAVAEFGQLLRERALRPTVWHLHGRIDNVDQIVLTSDGYDALYGSRIDKSRHQAAMDTLHAHLAGRTLLFIGFSLDDPFVAAQLRGVFKRFRGYAGLGYALIRERDTERVQAHIREHELPVTVVPFDDFGQPLLKRVQEMVACAQGTVPAPAPASSPAPAASREAMGHDDDDVEPADSKARHVEANVAASAAGTSNEHTELSKGPDTTATENRDGDRAGEDELDLLDIGKMSVARALQQGYLATLSHITGLPAQTIDMRLRDLDEQTQVQTALGDDWPGASELGYFSVARVLRWHLIPMVANIVGLPPRTAKERMTAAHGRTYVRSVFAAEWPQEADAAVGEAGDEVAGGGDGEPDNIDIGNMTIARALERGYLATLSRITGLPAETIDEQLRGLDAQTQIEAALAEHWPGVRELGYFSVARVQRWHLVSTVAKIVGLSPGTVQDRMAAAHGRTYVRSVFVAEWPDTADTSTGDDHEVTGKEADEDELDLLDIRKMTVAGVLQQGYVVTLSRITGLPAKTIERRLRGFDGRTRVRTALADDLPGVSELGYFSVAQVLKCHLIPMVASIVNLTPSEAQARLSAAHGRTYVRSVFATEWPDETGTEADEEVAEEGEEELDLLDIGKMTVARVLQQGYEATLSNITGVPAKTIKRRLRDFDVRTRVRTALADNWPGAGELGYFSVSRVLRWHLVPMVANIVGLSPRTVQERLAAAHGKTYVRSVFVEEWPEDEDVEADEEYEEENEEELDLLDIGKMTVARVLQQGYVATLSEITGQSQRTIKKQLAEFDGRTRVRTALADYWPGASELGYFSVSRVLRWHLVPMVANLVGLPPSEAQERLSAAHGKTYVRSVFVEEWPEDEDAEADEEVAEEGEEELELLDVGNMTVARVLQQGYVATLSKITGQSQRTIEKQLAEFDGRTRAKTALADYWPGANELGYFSVSRVLRWHLVPMVANIVGLSPGTVQERLAAAHGRTYVRSVFVEEWPEEEDIEADEEYEEESEEDDEEEMDLLDIGKMTVARALQQGHVATLSRITALSEKSIEQRLRGVHARTRVQTALVEVWPGANKLGSFSAAQILKWQLIPMVANIVGLPPETIQERLTAAHGRTYVRSVFAGEWPAEATIEVHEQAKTEQEIRPIEKPARSTPDNIPRDDLDVLIRPTQQNEDVLIILNQKDEDALVDLLEDCRSVRDRRILAAVVERLPLEIKSRIDAHSSLHIHLTNIVKTCAYYPGGIQALRDAIYRFEGRSVVLARIDELLIHLRSRRQ